MNARESAKTILFLLLILALIGAVLLRIPGTEAEAAAEPTIHPPVITAPTPFESPEPVRDPPQQMTGKLKSLEFSTLSREGTHREAAGARSIMGDDSEPESKGAEQITGENAQITENVTNKAVNVFTIEEGVVSGEAEPEQIEAQSPQPEPASPETKLVYLGQRQVYGYDICVECCGGKVDGITASGTVATVGRTVACNDLPFGTVLYIDGIGERIVEDRGGMVDGALDVLCDDHPACYAITGVYDIYIVEAAA